MCGWLLCCSADLTNLSTQDCTLWKFKSFLVAPFADLRGNGCHETMGKRWDLKNTNESRQLPAMGLTYNVSDSCWKAAGSVQVSSLKDSTNANSLWKWLCLSQQNVSQSICRSLSLTQGSYQSSFLISAWASPEPLWEDCDSSSELLPWEYTSFTLNSAALKCWHCLWHQRLWGFANNADFKAKGDTGLILSANFCGKVVSEVKCLFLPFGHQKTL